MSYGSTTAESDLILEHMTLVKRIVGRFDIVDGALDKEDLFSVGVMGLIDAIRKFDSSKCVPFEAYATVRIRGAIIDELRKSGRVSRDKIAKLNEYYSAKEKLEQKLMRSPQEHEICQELGISDQKLSQLHETVHYLSKISLEATLYHGDGSTGQLQDLIEDSESASPEEAFIRKERRRILQEAMGTLKEREQILLSLYYIEGLTLREIAYAMEISVPRVSQIHGKVLMKLRAYMSNAF